MIESATHVQLTEASPAWRSSNVALMREGKGTPFTQFEVEHDAVDFAELLLVEDLTEVVLLEGVGGDRGTGPPGLAAPGRGTTA